MSDERLMTEACCGEKFHSCRCIQAQGHAGEHECECGGSWNPDGSVGSLPRFVVEEGGPFPKGTDLDGLDDALEAALL